MAAKHWKPVQEWEQNHGDREVHPVWSIGGPPPFGGLRANGEDHAAMVCMRLNAMHEIVVAAYMGHSSSRSVPSTSTARAEGL